MWAVSEYSHCAALWRWASVSAFGNSSTILFRDNHSSSCWCFCHEQKATKVNGTHFDDKAGTAKCVFTAIAPGCRLEWRNVRRKKDGRLLCNPWELCWPESSSVEWLPTHLLLLPLHPHLQLSAPLPLCFTLALAQWQAPQLSPPIDRCWLQLLWII